MWHVSLPGIMSTIVLLLLLRVGNMMSVGADKVLLLYRPVTYETSDVIATYVYRAGLVGGRFGFGAAVGLFNSLVNIFLLGVFNFISKKVGQVSLW
jgi:putative aldouronate transport system permease protein